MRYRLIAKPNGYYDLDKPDNPTPTGDCAYLCDGDAHAAQGLYSLRAEVLIVAIDEPTVEAEKTA